MGEAAEIFRRLGNARDLEPAKTLSRLITVHRLEGDSPQALTFLRAALDRLRSAGEHGHPREVENVRSAVELLADQPRAAERRARRAVELAIDTVTPPAW